MYLNYLHPSTSDRQRHRGSRWDNKHSCCVTAVGVLLPPTTPSPTCISSPIVISNFCRCTSRHLIYARTLCSRAGDRSSPCPRILALSLVQPLTRTGLVPSPVLPIIPLWPRTVAAYEYAAKVGSSWGWKRGSQKYLTRG